MHEFSFSRVVLLVSIVLAFTVFGHNSSSTHAQDLADVIEKSERSVVRIEVKGKDGDSIGSGFVVESEGVIVTNVHVLAGAQSAVATFANGKSYKIEGTYYFDETRDICIAQLATEEDEDLPTIVVSRVPPRKGETVTALGAPRGLSFTATNGIVSAMRSGENLGGGRQGTWIQIDAALSPGNSGGPLINSKGRVIAMSTLASTGRSQNLNFGIAATDIKEAVRLSNDYELIPLREGVGELETEGGGGGADGESLIERPTIGKELLADYIEECREDYAGLKRRLLRNALEADKKYKGMRKGKVPLPVSSNADVVIVGSVRNKKREYYFRSEGTKRRLVRRAEKITDDFKKVKSALTKEATNEALFELLKFSGPYVDPTNRRSIGVLEEAIIVHAFNDHDVIVEFEGRPFLLWLPSTSGMSGGFELPPTTVYVSGTETVRIPGDSTMAVTVLVGLKDSELKKAIFGDVQNVAKSRKSIEGEMRTWKAGKHSVVAKVVGMEAGNVKLKKANGKTIEVPRSILSEEDAKYLDGLK